MKNLADLYGLSPATMAGLAQVAGTDPTATPTLDALKDYVPQATAEKVGSHPLAVQAKEILGTQPVQSISAKAENLGRALAGTGALGPAGLLVKPPPPEAAPAAAAPDTTPHAPDADPETAAIKSAREQDQAYAMQMLSAGGGGGGGQMVPGRWGHSTAKESREGNILDPARLEQMGIDQNSATGHSLRAADARHKAATIEAENDAAYAVAKNRALRIGAEEQAALQVARQNYIDEQMQKMQALAAEAKTKINPNEIWEKKGGGPARVLAAIAIGLGQFGALMRGGPNTAWQIIQHEIDGNIDAQKQRIANAKDQLSIQQNLYAQNLAQFGDKERAIAATRINYLDQVQNMLDMKRAEAKGHIADAAYEEMTAKTLDAKAKHEQEILELTKVKSTQELTDKWKDPAMVGGAANQGIAGMEERFVPDLGIYARTKEEAVKIRDHGSRTQVIVAALKDAQSVYARAAKTKDPFELRKLQAELESIRSRAAVQQTVKEGQGAMSKDDERVNSTAIGLFEGSVWRPNGELNNQAALAGKAITATQQAHGRLGSGGQRGAEVYVRDAKGNLVPRAVLFGSSAPQRNLTDNLDDKTQDAKGEVQKKP